MSVRLAVDASSHSMFVALDCHGNLHKTEVIERSLQSGQLVSTVMALLAREGLVIENIDGLVYGQGPGSFTGLRVTGGFLQGLAMALSMPVVQLSSMLCWAYGAFKALGEARVMVVLDAHRGAVYQAAFHFMEKDRVHTACQPTWVPAAEVSLPPSFKGESWVGVGDGWLVEGNPLVTQNHALLPSFTCHLAELALSLAEWGEGKSVTASDVQPAYLQDFVPSE